MRKKIVFLATTPFAVNAFLVPHLKELCDKFDIILCTNKKTYTLTTDLPDNIVVKHIDFQRKISLRSDLIAFIQLWILFISTSPSSIHSITPKAGLLTMLAGYFSFIPIRIHTFTGQIWTNKSGISRNILKFFDRVIVLLSTHIFSDSNSQNSFLVAEGIVSNEKIKVLGSGSIAGVDIRRFSKNERQRKFTRASLYVNESTIVFLFVGRIARDKGIFDLVEAYAQVSAIHKSIELWVVGPNDENLLGDLKKQSVYCDGVIRWLGETMSPEVFMQAADVLVLPSYREGFGSVIIEAAACGIPTLAYRINGIIDAVVHNETGILVPFRSKNALVIEMIKLILNDDYRKKLGHQAYSRAHMKFSEKQVTAAWVAFYLEIFGTT